MFNRQHTQLATRTRKFFWFNKFFYQWISVLYQTFSKISRENFLLISHCEASKYTNWIKYVNSNFCCHTVKYEACPKSIRSAYISSRQSARAASAGYERNQSLTNSLNAIVTGRTPWVARSVCLCPTCFVRSLHLFTVENDRKNRSTNLHKVLLQSWQKLYGDDWNDTEGLYGRMYGHNTDKGVVEKSTSKSEPCQVNADYFFRLWGCCALRICSKRSDYQQRILRWSSEKIAWCRETKTTAFLVKRWLASSPR